MYRRVLPIWIGVSASKARSESTPNEKKYQINEQECLVVVLAVELFKKYIRNQKTIVSGASMAEIESRRIESDEVDHATARGRRATQRPHVNHDGREHESAP